MRFIKNLSAPAIFLCVMLLALSGYVLYKNREKEGFWWGALAVGLVATIILVGILDKPSIPSMAAVAPAVIAPPVPTPAPTPIVPVTPPVVPVV